MVKNGDPEAITKQSAARHKMINLSELHDVFASIPGDGRSLYTDVFATGCYLHLNGSKAAGLKLIRDVFARVNRISSKDHSELFQNVISTLIGNEKKYALSVPLRAEFRALFRE